MGSSLRYSGAEDSSVTLEQRVSAIVEMKRRVGSLSGSAYVSEGKSDSTSPSSAAKVRAAHFS
eukprot:CAMPEP_0182842318 /NCGR_PEP_ID=MMETSP0006_2-20121128/25557_1 /TAXON_ID=97485 /ORGANISM="Prymnesium parvum, Strain Texoma1" /LENGTH=62 /DNA_ID=CAMNT_0024971969 /DNA_START=10 /DNA_END=195 /DNA_ORIENTATION=+